MFLKDIFYIGLNNYGNVLTTKLNIIISDVKQF